MHMDDLKRDEITKEKSLALKVYDSDESELDQEHVPFIIKNFKKFFKKKDL